jgi:aspartyl-tRNA(Asn)/glutamyl-tRNA(Gln) amidotransferase subunit A
VSRDLPRSLTAAARALRHGDVRAIDLVNASLEAIDLHQPRTNAFTVVHADAARADAMRVDAERASGIDRGPLQGLPISLKDLIDVRGQVTSAGSRVLRDRIAGEDAPIVTRLREAGAVVIGRTNLHEFALGTTSDDSAFGPVRNPLDHERVAGGSSGGSAAAVATGMGLASIGTDTGGSIRIPAAACGIVGLKPGYGEVPTEGVIPLSPSFDHVGPLTVSVEDTAMLWAVLAARPTPRLDPPERIRLVELNDYFHAPVAPEVRDAFAKAMARLERAGAARERRDLPSATGIVGAYPNVVLYEAAAWHGPHLDSRGADYSPTVRTRLESGRSIPIEAYQAAQAFCDVLRREVDAALEGCDALALPTLPIIAQPIGATDITVDPALGDRTPVRAAMLKHTQPFNLTGHPAISLPLRTAGLPAGLQLVGRRGETPALLAIAAACEKILG